MVPDRCYAWQTPTLRQMSISALGTRSRPAARSRPAWRRRALTGLRELEAASGDSGAGAAGSEPASEQPPGGGDRHARTVCATASVRSRRRDAAFQQLFELLLVYRDLLGGLPARQGCKQPADAVTLEVEL
jgi:hypothetical protein